MAPTRQLLACIDPCPPYPTSAPFFPFGFLFYLKNGGSMFLQNAATYLPNYMAHIPENPNYNIQGHENLKSKINN
jgi:hypothetical protein